jgi:hypothetical protein
LRHNGGMIPKAQAVTTPMSKDITLPANVFFVDPVNQKLVDSNKRPLSISWSQGFQVFSLTAVLIFSLCLLVSGVQQLMIAFQLDHSETTVPGKIISRRYDATAGKGHSISYYVTYQFWLADQKMLTREQFVRKEVFDQLLEESPVEVKYLELDPTVSTLVRPDMDRSLSLNGYLFAIFGALVSIITLLFLVPLVYQSWRNERLRRQGKLLVGHVLACHRYITQTSTSLDPAEFGSALPSNFFIELSYSVHVPHGSEIKAIVRQKRNDLKGTTLPKFGTPVAVLYCTDDMYSIL